MIPILALPGEITPGQLGPMSLDFDCAQYAPHLDHVVGGDALGDADNQRQPCVLGFQNRIGCKRWGHEDHGGIGPCGLDRLGNGIEYRPAFMDRAALARGHSAHYFGSVLSAALGMEGAFLARNTLHDKPRIFVH